MSESSGLSGLIIGVANKRSISWAIARSMAEAGARMAVTYQGERLEENVRELTAELSDTLVLPLDVTSDEQLAAVAARCGEAFGGLDFVVHGAAFAPREELSRPFVETSRDGFRLALDISAYSLISVTRATRPLLEKRGGGSILTLTHLGSDRVFPNYNVMGVAKAALESTVRYLAAELGPQNIRVNAISVSRRLFPKDSLCSPCSVADPLDARHPASAASRRCCRRTAIGRRCAATPRPPRSATPRGFC
jgi:enoyl-[acyl-carrier protein] reductase I